MGGPRERPGRFKMVVRADRVLFLDSRLAAPEGEKLTEELVEDLPF